MTDLPDRSHLVSGTTTEAQFQIALGDMYDYLKQQVTGAEPEALLPVDGVITPEESTLWIVDTENGTPTDNLDFAAAENIGEKIVMMKITSDARVLTIRHNQSGSGKFMLANAENLLMDSVNQMIAFRYNPDEEQWEELWRNWGVFAPTAAAKTAARTALGLGGSAVLNAGTGSPDNVARISDLGALAFLGALTHASMINDGVITNAKVAAKTLLATRMADTTPNSVMFWNSSGIAGILTATTANTYLRFTGSALAFEELPSFVTTWTAGSTYTQYGKTSTQTYNAGNTLTAAKIAMPVAGSVRFSYQIARQTEGSGGSIQGVVYKNGSNIDSYVTPGSNTSFTTRTVDINIQPGDVIELRISNNGYNRSGYVRNIYFRTLEPPNSIVEV